MSPDRTEMACSAVQAQLGAILKHKQVGSLPTHTETNPTGTDDLSVKMKSEDYQRKARGHILKYPSEESQKVQPRAVKSQRKTRTETLRVTTERWSPAVGGRMGEGVRGTSFQLQPPAAGASVRHGDSADSACCASARRLDREAEGDGAAEPGDSAGACLSQAEDVRGPTPQRQSDSGPPPALSAAHAGAHGGDAAHPAAPAPNGCPPALGAPTRVRACAPGVGRRRCCVFVGTLTKCPF